MSASHPHSSKLLFPKQAVSSDVVESEISENSDDQQALLCKNGSTPSESPISPEPESNLIGATVELTIAAAATDKPTYELTMRKRLLETISPVEPGLCIVSVPDPSYLNPVRLAVTKMILEASNVLDIPFPFIGNVISLFSGNRRQLEQANALAAINTPTTGVVLHEFKSCVARDKLDWSSNEGQFALRPILEQANGGIIMEQTMVCPISPAVTHGLNQISNVAQSVGAYAILLLATSSERDCLQLRHVCDELIEVAPCEPDVGDDAAFSFDCVGLRELNSLGIGKTMCSVKFSEGLFQHRFDPFISGNLETRIMWTMRGQGMSLDDIGAQFKKHKTSVMRRLQPLPKPRHLDLPKDWLSNNLEMFSVPSSGAKSNAEGERVGDDAEGETPAEPLVKPLRC